MRIFLTGGTGLVGNAILDQLQEQEHVIQALTREPEKTGPHVQWIRGDLREPDSFSNTMTECDVAILCAGVMSPDPEENFKVNRDATEMLIKETGAQRIVYISSNAVYGDSNHLLTDEDAPLLGNSSYALSKIQAEQMVLNAPIQSWVFRPCMITGPGDKNLAPAIRELVRQPVVPLPGHGLNKIDLVLASDVAAMAIRAGVQGRGGPGPYNLTGGNPLTLRQILEKFAHLENVSPQWRELSLEEAHQELAFAAEKNLPPPIPPQLVGIASYHWTYSIDKARNELGYEPGAF